MLGLPHSEIPTIDENAAMQVAHGRDKRGRASLSAFKTVSFQVGRGPNGEQVRSMLVGTGGKISFLLPDDMAGQHSCLPSHLAALFHRGCRKRISQFSPAYALRVNVYNLADRQYIDEIHPFRAGLGPQRHANTGYQVIGR
jgi:hypothetical protein